MTNGLKKSTTGVTEGGQKIIGTKSKPGMGNIFSAFKNFIHEPPLVKFRRIVKEKVIKKKTSPILQLIQVVNSIFKGKKGAINKPTHTKFKRKTRRRIGTNIII
jgi:hypothetical protein